MSKRADELVEGDVIDLYGDPFADPERDPGLCFEHEYALVLGWDRETSDTTVIYTDAGTFGFPHGHMIEVDDLIEGVVDERAGK